MQNSLRHTLATLSLLALCARCSSPLPSASRVRGLRVLAVQSLPAELGPADTAATVRAIVVDGADPVDAGDLRIRSIRWFFCDDSHTSDPVGCARTPSAHSPAGDGESIAVARAQLGPQRARGLLVALCPGAAATYDEALSIINCPDERGRAWSETEGVLAFYAVRAAADGATPNRAPAIEALSIGASNEPAPSVPRCASEPCASIDWVLTPSAESAEPTATGREALTVSFFATDGSFDRPRAITAASSDGRDRSLRAKWTAPRVAGLVRAWVVLRDDRGASAVIERSVRVE
jgi:hypothetical protein